MRSSGHAILQATRDQRTPAPLDPSSATGRQSCAPFPRRKVSGLLFQGCCRYSGHDLTAEAEFWQAAENHPHYPHHPHVIVNFEDEDEDEDEDENGNDDE